MAKLVAWALVALGYFLWFWMYPIMTRKRVGLSWYWRVLILHGCGLVGWGLGMLISWVLKTLM